MSWSSGMPTIMPNVSRSRRIWMNSLHDNRPEPPPVELCSFTMMNPFRNMQSTCSRRCRVAGKERCAADDDLQIVHEKLSLAVSIRLMNTSSSPDSICSQRYAPVIHGRDAGAQFFRVAPADVQRRAKRDDLFHAGQAADFVRQRRQISGRSLPRSSARRSARLRPRVPRASRLP